MKKYLLILMVFVGSCHKEAIEEETYETLCDEALAYIEECVGYRPYIGNCDNEKARRILNTPCERVESLWK